MSDYVVIKYDDDGDPVCCFNRKYMSGKFLSPSQLCRGCEFEIADLFHGTTKKSFYGWYCDFESGKVAYETSC